LIEKRKNIQNPQRVSNILLFFRNFTFDLNFVFIIFGLDYDFVMFLEPSFCLAEEKN